MADYGCFAWSDSRELRHARPRPGGDLDLSLLGVPPQLVSDLTSWHAEWERAAYGQAPQSRDDVETWGTRGRDLACRLQLELPDIEVQVWDEAGSQPVAVVSPRRGGGGPTCG